MPSQYYVPPFNSTLTYRQYDIVYGLDIGGSVYPTPYFYATTDTAGGYSPSGIYNFPITQYSRSDDVTTLTYSHTGGPAFGVGSVIRVTGVSANSSVNYTGMIIAGGSGTISYVNGGYPQTQSISVGAINCLSPAWTTGFCFIPTYTSKIPTENKPIVTQLGDGYQQRQPMGLNTFTQNPTFVYQNIDKRQMKAITNFVQDAAGVYPFQVLFNDAYLNNQPSQRYTAASVDVTPVSFGRYDCQVQLARVFDIN